MNKAWWIVLTILGIAAIAMIFYNYLNFGVLYSPGGDALESGVQGCPPNSDCCKCCLIRLPGLFGRSVLCTHLCSNPFESCSQHAQDSWFWATCTPDNFNEDKCSYTQTE